MKINLEVCKYCARHTIKKIPHGNLVTTQYTCLVQLNEEYSEDKTIAWKSRLPFTDIHYMNIHIEKHNCPYLLEHIVSKEEPK